MPRAGTVMLTPERTTRTTTEDFNSTYPAISIIWHLPLHLDFWLATAPLSLDSVLRGCNVTEVIPPEAVTESEMSIEMMKN